MSLTLHRRPATEAELRRIANAVARREVTYAEVERQLGYAPRTLPSRVRKALGPSYVRRQRRAFILGTVADLQPCTAEQVADDLELSPDSVRRMLSKLRSEGAVTSSPAGCGLVWRVSAEGAASPSDARMVRADSPRLAFHPGVEQRRERGTAWEGGRPGGRRDPASAWSDAQPCREAR